MAELEVIDDAARWDALTAATGFSPWQQSRAYGLALAAAGHAVGRWRIDVGGATVGCVQAVGRLAAGGRIGVWHALGGPMWRPGVGAVTKRAGLDALSAELGGRLRPVLVTPALAVARTPMPADAGGRRFMTGYTTALLPVAASAERQAARLHAGWRGALKRGLGAGLEIACRDARSDLLGLDAALARHEDERRRRGYGAQPTALVAAAARRGPALLATASGTEGPAAFMLVFLHGASATYQVGWTGVAGRAACAHHRLLWTVLAELRARRVRLLDLGGLNVPAGIAYFKLAAGALPRTFAGTYLLRARLTARARCPSRESRASSRADSSAGRHDRPAAARTSSACRAGSAG